MPRQLGNLDRQFWHLAADRLATWEDEQHQRAATLIAREYPFVAKDGLRESRTSAEESVKGAN